MTRRLRVVVGFGLMLCACGGSKNSASPVSDIDASGDTAGIPAGWALAPGFQDQGAPKTCDNISYTSCSGACVSLSSGSNNCQAMGVALIFAEMVSDANGIYVSQQGFTHSEVDRIDPTSGMLVPLATPDGSNDHVYLGLTDSSIYFEANDAVYSIPRAGGTSTSVLPSVTAWGPMAVVGQRLFINSSSTQPLTEVDLSSGTVTPHDKGITGIARDGSDIYFTKTDGVYLAPSANFASVQTLAPGPISALLGVSGNWVYVLVGSDVRRLPKTGGDTQVVMTLEPQGIVRLASDALVFTRPASDRVYVCTAGLDGTQPTVHGYLPAGVPSKLNADANFVYAVQGFYMVHFGR